MDYQYAEIPDNIEWEKNMGMEISYYGDGTICGLLVGDKIYFIEGWEEGVGNGLTDKRALSVIHTDGQAMRGWSSLKSFMVLNA